MATSKKTGTPKKWWQWFLIYPSLGVALLGYTPQLIKLAESYTMGVAYERVEEAKKSKRLFEKHLSGCLIEKKPLHFVTEQSIDIKAWLCDYDILIQVEGADGSMIGRGNWWLDLREFQRTLEKPTGSILNLFIGPLYAAEIKKHWFKERQSKEPEVLCWAWLDKSYGTFVQIVKHPETGECYRRVTNSYTGITNVKKVSCSATCDGPDTD